MKGISEVKAADKNEDKIQIVTTVYPEYDWVKQVLGNRAKDAEITLLTCDGEALAAEDKEKKAEELQAEYQSQLSGVEDEKKAIIAEARNNAKGEYDKIVARANDDAVKIKQDAKKASELESEKARLAVKQEIAELAMQAATKVVEKEVSPETNKMLYDQFLNESSDK